MGLLNPRARCPKCAGKIHTHTDFFVISRTGTKCQHCGAALSGKVQGKWGERAEERNEINKRKEERKVPIEKIKEEEGVSTLKAKRIHSRREKEAMKKENKRLEEEGIGYFKRVQIISNKAQKGELDW